MKKTLLFCGLFLLALLFCPTQTIAQAYSLSKQKIKSTGNFSGLVLLVEFKDTPFKTPAGKFTALFNEPGYNYQDARGSVRDYFVANSDGLFIPE